MIVYGDGLCSVFLLHPAPVGMELAFCGTSTWLAPVFLVRVSRYGVGKHHIGKLLRCLWDAREGP